MGGDCLADLNQLRAEPGVFGAVASDPTVSRLIGSLASDPARALSAIASARAVARSRVWAPAGDTAPDHGVTADAPLVIDLDATLITAHSEKADAAPNFKRGFGFHPLCAFADHGTGEPLAIVLRPGNAGSNTAADHITVLGQALAQFPGEPGYRVGRKVLVRADAGGGTHEFLTHLTRRRLTYSIGFSLTDTIVAAVDAVPEAGWIPAVDDDTGTLRDGAWVADDPPGGLEFLACRRERVRDGLRDRAIHRQQEGRAAAGKAQEPDHGRTPGTGGP
ncbi:hypothetical protein GCM10023147_41620 [Tsukamurella soli]|uniref:Transposase DDE domain-containing protein n=1 Tax=Tsukamurella soli TaxID=644556 RepID=A0ABP8K7L0_9ACTN